MDLQAIASLPPTSTQVQQNTFGLTTGRDPSIYELAGKLYGLKGENLQPQTPEALRDKGAPGKAVERKLGLTNNSSRSADTEHAEVKTCNFTFNSRKQRFEAKESIKITAINEEIDFTIIDPITSKKRAREFEETHTFEKIKSILIVAMQRSQDRREAVVYESYYFNIDDIKNSEIYAACKKDYLSIRDKFLSGQKLSSRDGVMLQARTAGRGRGAPQRRAFYLRRSAVNKIIFEHSEQIQKA